MTTETHTAALTLRTIIEGTKRRVGALLGASLTEPLPACEHETADMLDPLCGGVWCLSCAALHLVASDEHLRGECLVCGDYDHRLDFTPWPMRIILGQPVTTTTGTNRALEWVTTPLVWTCPTHTGDMSAIEVQWNPATAEQSGV